MSNYLSEEGTFINSLIGEGSLFVGDISLKGLLRIDGDFKGTIANGGKVLIGKSGRAEASIQAGTVVIGGVLKGNVAAEDKVVILSTGMVIGNITAPRLLVEDGVIINGSCSIAEKKASDSEYGNETEGFLRYSMKNTAEREIVSSWKE
jgi:cytoskeletal protein CcmA (bactofilin family)